MTVRPRSALTSAHVPHARYPLVHDARTESELVMPLAKFKRIRYLRGVAAARVREAVRATRATSRRFRCVELVVAIEQRPAVRAKLHRWHRRIL